MLRLLLGFWLVDMEASEARAQRTHFWLAQFYAEGMTSRVPTSTPTPNPEHLPTLLGHRMNLDPSAPWLSSLVLPEVQGCLWLELQMHI